MSIKSVLGVFGGKTAVVTGAASGIGSGLSKKPRAKWYSNPKGNMSIYIPYCILFSSIIET